MNSPASYELISAVSVAVAWPPATYAPVLASASTPSAFGDELWDLSALPGTATNWTKQIDFSRLGEHGVTDAETIEQLKQILFFFLHEEGTQLPASGTFLGKYYALRTCSALANAKGKTLYGALADYAFDMDFILGKPFQAIELFPLLTRLCQAVETFPADIPFKKLHAHLVEANRRIRENEQQTPIIPSKIYSHVLSALSQELRQIEEVLPDLLQYLADSFHSSRGGYPSLPPGLMRYSEHLQQPGSIRGSQIAAWVSNAYVVCGAVICANTGMRRNEVQQLPLAPLSHFTHAGKTHACIRGYTTKFNNGVGQEVTWITNALGAKAAELASKLATHIHSLHGASSTEDGLLLFPRHGFGSYGEYMGRKSQSADLVREKLFLRIVPKIESEDIEELERIDFERSWQDDPKFKPGLLWPFSLHQLRRSLAVYAHRSGLVSLPSLKAQLQHLTQEMSMYYAKGSPFAETVLFDKDHFAVEWNASKVISDYLGYALNVLMSDERLFGGAAAWAASQAVKSSPVSVYSREHAVQMFKRGEIAFRETPIGGCTSTTQCDSSPFNPLPLECLESNCKNLVVSPRKLQRAVESQTILVQKLETASPNSVEYRMEKRGLEILVRVVAKIHDDEVRA
jgi:hypothetical protein